MVQFYQALGSVHHPVGVCWGRKDGAAVANR